MRVVNTTPAGSRPNVLVDAEALPAGRTVADRRARPRRRSRSRRRAGRPVDAVGDQRPDRRAREQRIEVRACDACGEVGPLDVGSEIDEHPARCAGCAGAAGAAAAASAVSTTTTRDDRRGRAPPAARRRPLATAHALTGSGSGLRFGPVAVVADDRRLREVGEGQHDRERALGVEVVDGGDVVARLAVAERLERVAAVGPSVASTHTSATTSGTSTLSAVAAASRRLRPPRRLRADHEHEPAPRPGNSAIVAAVRPRRSHEAGVLERGEQVVARVAVTRGACEPLARAARHALGAQARACLVADPERLQRLMRRRSRSPTGPRSRARR